MNIEPLTEKAMEFLKKNVPMPSLGTVTNIGEISEVEWYEGNRKELAGCLYLTNENPRVVGFKRIKHSQKNVWRGGRVEE